MTVLKVVKKKQNKIKAEISGLSPDYFQGRVWPVGVDYFCVLLLEI